MLATCVRAGQLYIYIHTNGGHYPMLAQVVYIAYTPLCEKWCLCTRRLAYILHELWLLGVFRVYTTLNLGLWKFAAHMPQA